MKNRVACFAYAPPAETFDDFVARHLVLHDGGKRQHGVFKKRLQLFRLRQRAREAIQ